MRKRAKSFHCMWNSGISKCGVEVSRFIEELEEYAGGSECCSQYLLALIRSR